MELLSAINGYEYSTVVIEAQSLLISRLRQRGLYFVDLPGPRLTDMSAKGPVLTHFPFEGELPLIEDELPLKIGEFTGSLA